MTATANAKILKLIIAMGLVAPRFEMFALAQDRLISYPAPAGVALNDDFNVKVRTPGGA